MSAITATVAPSPSFGFVNPAISAMLGDYLTDYWPPHEADPGVALGGALTRHAPVAAAHRSISASAAPGYGDDFYFRVHARPNPLALGDLVSAQTRTIEVWNAWPATSQTLNSATLTGDEGIGITPPASFPMAFAPLQARSWTVSIGLSGPPQIAASIAYVFADSGQNVDVAITGSRVAIWSWPPDWANGVTERLSWTTDVLMSPTGAEQRRGLRQSPRVTWDFDVIAEGDDRAALDLGLFAALGRRWCMPVWHDVWRLESSVAVGATTLPTGGDRDYQVGGLAVLLGEDSSSYEAVEVLSVSGSNITTTLPLVNAWPAGTRIYPARIVQFVDMPQIQRETDTIIVAQVQLQSAEAMDYTAAAPATTYRGLPVLEQQPAEGALQPNWQRVGSVLDFDVGIPSVVDTAGVGFAGTQHAWLVGTRSEHNALRGLLYALAGRRNAIWWPTYASDLRLVDDIGAADTTLKVRNIGYARLAAAQPMRRDIRIELKDGTAYHRRISAASIVDTSTEQVGIDSALGAAVTVAQIRKISFMALRRLDQDDIELLHETDADGITSCTLTTRAVRDDLEAA